MLYEWRKYEIYQGEYRILSKVAIATQIYDYTVLCPEIARIAKPGQFVIFQRDFHYVDLFLSVELILRRDTSLCI